MKTPKDADIHALGALELRSRLDDGDLTSVGIVEALIARAEEIDGAVRAFVERFDEEALAMAAEADRQRGAGETTGPLHGIPITIKESIAIEGTRSTLGLPCRMAEPPAAADAVVVRLLRDAGAILFGKTNVSQLLLFHESENPVFGRTLNPWDPERTPGGSSGGEAAAIAAGMSPWGIGTDIGGSIRVPATFSGIAGLKPTFGRWSAVGVQTGFPGQEVVRGQVGPMARSAADLALLWSALDSPKHHRLDATVPPIPTADPAGIDIGGLRIGFFEDDGFLAPSAAVARAVREAASALEGLGARLEPYASPLGSALIMNYYRALSSGALETARAQLGGDPPAAQLRPLLRTASLPPAVRRLAAWAIGRKGEPRVQDFLKCIGAKSAAELWRITQTRTEHKREVLDAWDEAGIDAVVCPAHATPALGHGQSAEFSVGGSYSMRYNYLDFPAGVVPITRVRDDEIGNRPVQDRFDRTAADVDDGSSGLPVGVQVVARPYREDLVLAIMIALEGVLCGNDDYPRTPVDPPAGAVASTPTPRR